MRKQKPKPRRKPRPQPRRHPKRTEKFDPNDWRDGVKRLPTAVIEFFAYAALETAKGPVESGVTIIFTDAERWVVLWRINDQGLALDPDLAVAICAQREKSPLKLSETAAKWFAELDASAKDAIAWTKEGRRPPPTEKAA